jgi:hypothetical protein
MPGFLGCVSATAVAAQARIAQIHEYEERVLPGHARYATRDALRDQNALVLTLLPRLRVSLSGSHRAPDGTGALTYVGRFEEAPFARNGDTDAIARSLWNLYRERGKAFVHALAGSFLIYVNDHQEQRALLINDHFGSYQCFFTVVDQVLCFAPEVNILMDACKPPAAIDVASVLSMFVNGHLLSSGSYLREVKGLPPGTMVEVSPHGGIQFDRHYRFAFQEPPEEHPDEHFVSGLSVRLMGALESRADILADTIIPLSGGWDSRGLAACAAAVAKRNGTRIRTVTWGIPGGEDVPDTDPPIARAGTEHTYVPRPVASWIDDFESMFTMLDGHTDDCVFHPNEHALLSHLHTDLGGHHIYSGNHMFGPAGEAATDTEAKARIGIYHLTDFEPLWELFNQAQIEQLRGLSEDYAAQVLADCTMKDFNNRKDYLHYSQRLQVYTMRSAHYKQCAIWVHNPWLDREIVDFMTTVPTRLRVVKQLYKRAMQSLFPELEKLPHAGVRFDNIEDWDTILRTQPEIRNYVLQHLLGEENGLHALLDMDRLRAFIDGFFDGKPIEEPPLVVLVNKAKQMLQHFPPVYRALKRTTMDYLHVRELTASTVLLRLLILKKVYDRYGS